MKLVIDIPEGLYNNISKDCGIYPYRLVYDAMKNGIPLPKGHGRLIDADAAKCSSCDKFGCENSDICSLYNAPTIIEADGGAE